MSSIEANVRTTRSLTQLLISSRNILTPAIKTFVLVALSFWPEMEDFH